MALIQAISQGLTKPSWWIYDAQEVQTLSLSQGQMEAGTLTHIDPIKTKAHQEIENSLVHSGSYSDPMKRILISPPGDKAFLERSKNNPQVVQEA